MAETTHSEEVTVLKQVSSCVMCCVGSGQTWLAESVANTRKSNTIGFARQRHSCSSSYWIWKNCSVCHPDHTESSFHKTGWCFHLSLCVISCRWAIDTNQPQHEKKHLDLQGRITLLVKWPFSLTQAISYWCSISTDTLTPKDFGILMRTRI